MSARRIAVALILTAGVFAAVPSPAAAQAWVPRAQQGGVTFVTQVVDHVGRMRGTTRMPCCSATNVGISVDVDYGLTNRWSVSMSLPYIFSKYRGGPPTGVAEFLPYPAEDECHCTHSAAQDLQFAARYNLVRVRRTFAITPSISVGMPSHGYRNDYESAVGFGLKQIRLGADAGQRLDWLYPGLSVEAGYQYAVVEKVLDLSHNRSNVQVSTHAPILRHLGGHVLLSWQRTHGGLRFPIDIEPFPERYRQFHRVMRDNYFQAGGGVSVELGRWQVSTSYMRTMRGTNTHDVKVYTVTAGRTFRIRR